MYKKKYSIENYIMNSRGSGNHANLVGEHCFYKKKVVFCHMNKQSMKGLYLDGFTSGITTRGNIMWNISGNIIDNNDGHDNHHFGNIGINISVGTHVDLHMHVDLHIDISLPDPRLPPTQLESFHGIVPCAGSLVVASSS